MHMQNTGIFSDELRVAPLTSPRVLDESGTASMTFGLLAPLTLAALALVTTMN